MTGGLTSLTEEEIQGEKIEKALSRYLERAFFVAEWTGLEPATPGVTGRYSNQLNYHSALTFSDACRIRFTAQWLCRLVWRPHGDSNPGYRRERAVS